MANRHSYDYDVLRNLGDMLLRIEIDADEWVGKPTEYKLEYLKYQLTKGNKSQLLNVGSQLLEGIFGLIRANTKNKTITSYLSLVETAIGLAKVSMVLNNTFVAHNIETRSDDDELAQFMGKSVGSDIVVFPIDTTAEACKVFLQMTKEQQAKYGVTVDKIEYMNENSTELSSELNTKSSARGVTAFMMLSMGKHKMGFEIFYSKPKNKNSGEPTDGLYSYINVGFYPNDVMQLKIPEKLIYSLYIESIDVKSNYIRIDAGKMKPEKRKVIDYDINNINLPEMSTTIKAVLKNNQRRGYMIQGDPGTGKTVSIHKLMMDFPETPVFWISADSIDTPTRVRSIFRILNMFPGSIFVFDDIDGNDMSAKNALTTTFLSCIDATNAEKFNGIIILTVNEPQRIHGSIKTRPERIDEVIMVKNPDTTEAVLDVVVQRFRHLKEDLPEWVSSENTKFVELAKKIVSNQFTHAQIATLVSDLVKLFKDDNENYTVDMFGKLIDRRILSIENTRMEANADGHIIVKGMTGTDGRHNVKCV